MKTVEGSNEDDVNNGQTGLDGTAAVKSSMN